MYKLPEINIQSSLQHHCDVIVITIESLSTAYHKKSLKKIMFVIPVSIALSQQRTGHYWDFQDPLQCYVILNTFMILIKWEHETFIVQRERSLTDPQSKLGRNFALLSWFLILKYFFSYPFYQCVYILYIKYIYLYF